MIISISNNASSLPVSSTSPLAEKTDSEISFAAALQQATADTAPSTASASAEATAATETSAVSAEQAQIAASIAAWKAATESYMPSLKTSTSDAIAPKISAPNPVADVADQDLTSLVAQAKQTSIDLNDMIERALQFASTTKASTQLPTDQAVSSASTDVKTVTADSASLDKVTAQPASAAANEQIVQNSQAQISVSTSAQPAIQPKVNNQPTTLADMVNKLHQESINIARLDANKTVPAINDLRSAASASLAKSVSGYDQLKIMMEKLNDTKKS